jgi:hypothetical protein
MLFHLTTEDHIRTSSEPGPANGGGVASRASRVAGAGFRMADEAFGRNLEPLAGNQSASLTAISGAGGITPVLGTE